MGVVVKCHPGVAVVAVDHCHPVRLVPLKTISFVLLTTSLIINYIIIVIKINSDGGTCIEVHTETLVRFLIWQCTHKKKQMHQL